MEHQRESAKSYSDMDSFTTHAHAEGCKTRLWLHQEPAAKLQRRTHELQSIELNN